MTKPKSKQPVSVGDIYACRGDDASWCVVKVLAMEKSVVYVRLYKNRFPRRPRKVDPETLTLVMTVEDLDQDILPIGISWMPIAKAAFIKEEKYFLTHVPVTREELEDL